MFKNFNPIWLIPITIMISIFIAVTVWFAAEGNTIFIFIGNGMLMIGAFLILIVFPSYLIHLSLRIRRITRYEVRKMRGDWNKIKVVFIENATSNLVGYFGS